MMKSRKMVMALLACVVGSVSVNGALTTSFGPVDNQASGNGMTFTPNDGASGPLGAWQDLASFKMLRSNSTGGVINEDTFLNVYSSKTLFDASTFLGTSSNALNLSLEAAGGDLLWNFGGISLDTATEYAVMFSTTNVAGDLSVGGVRLKVANPYLGGEFVREGAVLDSGWDADFVATYVPEPITMSMLAIGGAVTLSRKKRA